MPDDKKVDKKKFWELVNKFLNDRLTLVKMLHADPHLDDYYGSLIEANNVIFEMIREGYYSDNFVMEIRNIIKAKLSEVEEISDNIALFEVEYGEDVEGLHTSYSPETYEKRISKYIALVEQKIKELSEQE